MMGRWWTVAVPLIAVILLAGVAFAQMGWGSMGPGMGRGPMGSGMMGPGMMGGWYQGQPPGEALTLDQVEQRRRRTWNGLGQGPRARRGDGV
jgi:hypothetical protein